MAANDSRNTGGSRKFATLADAPKPQIASPLQSAVVRPPTRQMQSRAETGEQVKPLPSLSTVPPKGESNPPLKAILQATQVPTAPLSPTALTSSTVNSSLRPSVQMAPLSASAPLKASQYGTGYAPRPLAPEAGEYSYDPQITLPEHRFLTPSEL